MGKKVGSDREVHRDRSEQKKGRGRNDAKEWNVKSTVMGY